MSTPVPAWIPLRFHDPSRIESFRDTCYDHVATDTYTREHDPHISFLPGFTVPRANLSALRRRLDRITAPLADVPVTFTDFYLYPSRDDPMVVCLDANIDLAALRERAIDAITDHDGHIVHDPVAPHLTLFKAADASASADTDWDGLTDAAHSRLTTLLDTTTPRFHATISDHTMEPWGDAETFAAYTPD